MLTTFNCLADWFLNEHTFTARYYNQGLDLNWWVTNADKLARMFMSPNLPRFAIQSVELAPIQQLAEPQKTATTGSTKDQVN